MRCKIVATPMVANSTWILEKELLKLAAASTIEEAVQILNLLPEAEVLSKILVPSVWIQGSETMSLPFSIVSISGVSSFYVLKTVIAFSALRSIEETLVQWVGRRKLIEKSGIRVPKLYFVGNGMTIEEFLSKKLRPALIEAETKKDLLVSLLCYAGTLHRLGFRPIDAFEDLRTDGQSVIPIDFGEDLGPPSLSPVTDPLDLYIAAVKWLYRAGVELDKDHLAKLKTTYLLRAMQVP